MTEIKDIDRPKCSKHTNMYAGQMVSVFSKLTSIHNNTNIKHFIKVAKLRRIYD
jgi:hypothetical protein